MGTVWLTEFLLEISGVPAALLRIFFCSVQILCEGVDVRGTACFVSFCLVAASPSRDPGALSAGTLRVKEVEDGVVAA